MREAPDGRLDDDDHPAYTMGRAAEMIGTSQSFIAARARELVDQRTPIEAACRITIIQDSSKKPSASTPNTGAPPHPPALRPSLEAVWGPPGTGPRDFVSRLFEAFPVVTRCAQV
ncbi:hypothetical protein GCM10010261_67530 [Streptomyces pilosus]|nr:hypothetical protein GCM10010261_67530 [Streptomyces pilosus]